MNKETMSKILLNMNTDEISKLFIDMNYHPEKNNKPKTLFKDIFVSKEALDAHSWCEKNGEVVFDIDYPERDTITKKVFNLTDKKIYKKFDPLLQKLCFKSVEGNTEQTFKSIEKQVKKILNNDKIDKIEGYDIPCEKLYAEILLADSQNCPNRCFLFAYCYKILNPDVELVCGSMGWEGVDGEPHYEWG